MFPRNVFAPSSAIFLISTPIVEGLPTDTCRGGLPMMRFRRMTFPWTPAARKIPFVFPTTVFSSITLPVSLAATRPMPKLFAWTK